MPCTVAVEGPEHEYDQHCHSNCSLILFSLGWGVSLFHSCWFFYQFQILFRLPRIASIEKFAVFMKMFIWLAGSIDANELKVAMRYEMCFVIFIILHSCLFWSETMFNVPLLLLVLTSSNISRKILVTGLLDLNQRKRLVMGHPINPIHSWCSVTGRRPLKKVDWEFITIS